jgi:hypothetical protein
MDAEIRPSAIALAFAAFLAEKQFTPHSPALRLCLRTGRPVFANSKSNLKPFFEGRLLGGLAMDFSIVDCLCFFRYVLLSKSWLIPIVSGVHCTFAPFLWKINSPSASPPE